MKSINVQNLAWGALFVICFAYAPIAMEYMVYLYDIDTPQLWNTFFAMVTSKEHALGPGSFATEQHEWYLKSRLAMTVHTMIGSLTIIIAILQFSKAMRSRYPRAHKWLGRTYLILVTISMLNAFLYLLRTGPENVFNGPAFYAQLWFLGIGVLVGSWLGFAFILKGKVRMHQAAMAYGFALLLTTPLLRILWLFLGVLWPDVTQEVTNIAGGALLGTLSIFGAMVAARCLDTRTAVPKNYRFLPGKKMELLFGLLAVPSIIWIAMHYMAEIGTVDRLLASAILSVLIVILATAALAQSARRSGRTLAADEWRIHFLATLAIFPMFALVWAIYELVFPVYDSFYAAVLTGPGYAMSLGYLVMTLRRR